MNQNKNLIEIIELEKSYGNFLALKPLNLAIQRGELFGFLGPNGAGKTTLIRILAGLIKANAGKILIDGEEITNNPRTKSMLGYIPDRPYLYEKLTPLEYFDFVGGLYSVKKATILEKGEHLLKLFDLWHKRDDLLEGFSHGMKQKVAIGAATLHDPQILIVDEPTVGLDPKSVKLVKDFFKSRIAEGKTIFLTTHTLSVAEDLCSRIGIIRSGEIIALGSLQELQKQASMPNNHLEEIFLRLTEEAAEEAAEEAQTEFSKNIG